MTHWAFFIAEMSHIYLNLHKFWKRQKSSLCLIFIKKLGVKPTRKYMNMELLNEMDQEAMYSVV